MQLLIEIYSEGVANPYELVLFYNNRTSGFNVITERATFNFKIQVFRYLHTAYHYQQQNKSLKWILPANFGNN